MLALEDKAKAYARTLSGGMRRRLLIAKAMVHDPEILILDEPTAGVDVELRSNLWENIHKLNQNGKTIIITTHYLHEAEELCNEIAIINDFLPKQLNEVETKKICLEKIKEVGAVTIKDMGKVIGPLKKEYSDVMDFSKVSQIIRENLK